MCGIYGFYSFKIKVDISHHENALQLLSHRGPDGYGVLCGNYDDESYNVTYNKRYQAIDSGEINYFLGHRRLSIIDLGESASQPFITSDESLSIVFNGEIYNHVELRTELEALGHSFKTDHSDTEVLLLSYQAWGVDCLGKLRGMFAFVIHDNAKKKLFIARDRVGLKTLYYSLTDNEFIFSSELGALLEGSAKEHVIDNAALAEYLTYGYVPAPRSIYKDIFKVKPATYLIFDLKDKSLEETTYWDVDISSDTKISFSSWKKEIDTALNDSINVHLRSDVPIGIFTSGGIDSTLVLKKSADTGMQGIDTYAADFPDKNISDRKYIDIVNTKYDTKLHVKMIGESGIEDIDNIINVFDEPFDGGSSIALYELFKSVKLRNKVVFSGDGGDEIFAGYERYSRFLYVVKLKNALRFIPGIYQAICFLNKFSSLRKSTEKIKKIIELDEIDYFTNVKGKSRMAGLLKEEVRDVNIYSRYAAKLNAVDVIKNIQYLEFKTILPGRMLYKLDRLSMHFGVEARPPIIDHVVVEQAFKIPSGLNVGINKSKALLKSLVQDDFSMSFIKRQKKGFGSPIKYWFENFSSDRSFGILADNNNILYHFLDYDKTNTMFSEIKDGYKGKNHQQLWRLLVLSKYLENNSKYIEL